MSNGRVAALNSYCAKIEVLDLLRFLGYLQLVLVFGCTLLSHASLMLKHNQRPNKPANHLARHIKCLQLTTKLLNV